MSKPYTPSLLTITPLFKLVFLTVAGFTFITLLAAIGISFVSNPSDL